MIWKPGDNYPSNSRGEQLDIMDGEILSDDECSHLKVPVGSVCFPDHLFKVESSFQDRWIVVEQED